jgi:RsiW-degrading membrane proteinase PrsW (M82 family)
VPSPKFIIQFTRGVIRDQRMRRTAMFYVTLASVLMLFFGATFLDRALREHPVWFILWWFACTWLMLTSVLLALFDMLVVRAQTRRARQELARKILGEKERDENSR